MKCKQCGREFLKEDQAASISGSIMGDECTDAYYRCPVCRRYTVAIWRDNFTGVETMKLSGPVSEHDGDERVRLIGRCSRTWDKKCRCEAHREYFNDALD
jgi:hypothetical protein